MNSPITYSAVFSNGRLVQATNASHVYTHAAQLVEASGHSFGCCFSTSAEGAHKAAKSFRSAVRNTTATVEVVAVDD